MMTQYISPFKTIGLDASQSIDKQAIALMKKKYLAEVELSPSQTIKIGDAEMTKNDVLNLFEKWNKIEDWDFHVAIANDVALLDFLTLSTYENTSKRFQGDYASLINKDGFVFKMGPFFSKSYSESVVLLLRYWDYKGMKQFFDEAPLGMMSYLEHRQANYSIQQYLSRMQSKIEFLSESVKQGKQLTISDFSSYCEPRFIKTLNELPEDDFEDEVNNMAIVLYNLSAALWNSNQRESAKVIVNHIFSLNCSDEMEQSIRTRKRDFGQVQIGTVDSEPSSAWNTFIIIVRILFFIMIFARACN